MTNFISSPPQVPSAYALSERSSQKELLEVLASFVSASSAAIASRASLVLSPYPYSTGILYVQQTGAPKGVLSVSVEATLTSGSQTVPIPEQAKISSVLNIQGGAYGTSYFFPLQCNSFSQSLYVAFSSGSLIVNSSGLSGLTLRVFILYV